MNLPLRGLSLLACVCLALLSGCASVPNVNIDKAQAASMKSVAIVFIPEVKEIGVVNLGGAASAFGLMGGIVQATMIAEHTKTFNAQFAGHRPPFAQTLSDAMQKALEADGYLVVLVKDQKPKLASDKKSDDFSDVSVEADTILSLWYRYAAYYSSPWSVHYEPQVLISAHLLDAKTKKELYFKTFAVGADMKIKDVVKVPADPKYSYSNFDALMEHKDEAVAGLLSCAQVAADQVKADLKPAAVTALRVASSTQ